MLAIGVALLGAGCGGGTAPANPDRHAELVPDPMDPSRMVRPGYIPAMPNVEDRMRLLIQPGSDVSQEMTGFPVATPESPPATSEVIPEP